MTDLLALSARFIDQAENAGAVAAHRLTAELSEVADGIALMEAFSNVVVLRTAAGLVLVDTSLERFAEPLLLSLRGYSREPVHTILYTHGHVDHVGGARAFIDETCAMGAPRPRVVGHENVPARFARYRRTNGYNALANRRQFAGPALMAEGDSFGPREWVEPDECVSQTLQLRIGDLLIELHHDLGETDDHLWAWLPERSALAVGDFFTWVFPNAGNPQKVQRYPLEWARALRSMAARQPELLLPAHGLPIGGRDRVARVLDEQARALESLVDQTLALMNQGASLDAIIHTVALPAELLGRPYLQPLYDDPEFVVRNIVRLYGGWYDGDPSHLLPAKAAELASELCALVGGARRLAARARELCDKQQLRLACHLAELAVQAAPDDLECHAARADVYATRREQERSLMAKGIFDTAARESTARLKP